MARSLKRLLKTLDYDANGVVQAELPRNHLYKGLLLRLSGTVNIAAGATDGAVHDEAPQSILRQVSFIRNGSEVLQRLDGGSLYQIGAVNWGTVPERTAPGAGVGNQAFEVLIPVDFAALGMLTPSMSLYRSAGTSSTTIEIAWGSEASLIVGGDRTESFTAVGGVAPTVEVYGLEIMDVTGSFADKKLHRIIREITAANTNFEIELPRGERYRRLFIKTVAQTDDPAAPGTPVGVDSNLLDTVLNEARLVLDGTLHLMDRFSNDAFRGHNKLQYQQETIQDGYYVVDFAEDGSPAGMIATEGVSDFKLFCDVNLPAGVGTVNMHVIPETYSAARVPVVE